MKLAKKEIHFFDLFSRLQKIKTNGSITLFSKTRVNTFLAHPKFLDLVPFLFISLEKNSSYNQLLPFKRKSRNLLFEVSLEVGRIFPDLKGEKAYKFLNISYATTSSFWAANSKNEALKRIYKQEEFKEMRPAFKKDLKATLEIIIKGLRT